MPAATESAAPAGPRGWVVWCWLGAAVALAYANSLQGPFVFDDLWTIRDQLYIRAPTHVVELFRLSPPRFLTMLSFAATYWLQGLTVWPYHLTNLVLYGLNGALVYRLFTRRLPGCSPADAPARAGALVATLGFLLTPAHAQVAAYVTGRSTLLGTLFLLLTVFAYARAAEARENGRGRVWLGVALLCYLLGNFSKEIVSVAPALLIAWELWGRGEVARATRVRRALGTWPFFAVLVAVLLYRRLALGAAALPEMPRSVAENLLTQSFVTWRYALMEFLPVGLTIDHGVRPAAGWGDPRVWAGLGGWALAGLVAWRCRRRAPVLTLALVWFFVCLLPDSSVIAMQDVMADHRAYLPGIGVWSLTAVGWGAWARAARSGSSHRAVRIGLLFTLIALVLLGTGTVLRNRVWANPLALWQEAVRESPGRGRPLANLAAYHLERGAYQRAIQLADQALERDAGIPSAYLNRGVAYLALGDLAQAEADISSFIALHAFSPRSWISGMAKLARAHYNLGVVRTRQGRYGDAVQSYQRALQLNPIDTHTLSNLGTVYERLGEFKEAEETYLQAVSSPGDTRVAWISLLRARQMRIVEDTLRAAVVAAPKDPYVHLRLGIFYDDIGLLGKAEAAYTTAAQLDPDETLTLVLLANLHRRQARTAEAVEEYRRVLEADPNNAEALWWRGQLLISQGLPFEAQPFLERARTADPHAGRPGWRPARRLRDGREVKPEPVQRPSAEYMGSGLALPHPTGRHV